MLDREGGYWTTIPNRERYAYRISDVRPGSREITVATVGKQDEGWERIATLPNLEELTLHEPSHEQLSALRDLAPIKRLRITHARPKDIRFIEVVAAVEELVLEYVSGFDDLTPLRALKQLRALHVENLRRVSSFQGLAGISGLKYLAVHGTLDWKQPIENFEFLTELPALEVLKLWQVTTKAPYPAMLPVLALRNLKKLALPSNYLVAEEYALLEEALDGVMGTSWGPYSIVAYGTIELPRDDVRAHLPDKTLRANHPEVHIDYSGKRTIDDPASEWFVFTGKGAGRVKCSSPKALARCREYAARYAEWKEQARSIIEREKASP